MILCCCYHNYSLSEGKKFFRNFKHAVAEAQENPKKQDNKHANHKGKLEGKSENKMGV
jgi:hypothetical protein